MCTASQFLGNFSATTSLKRSGDRKDLKKPAGKLMLQVSGVLGWGRQDCKSRTSACGVDSVTVPCSPTLAENDTLCALCHGPAQRDHAIVAVHGVHVVSVTYRSYSLTRERTLVTHGRRKNITRAKSLSLKHLSRGPASNSISMTDPLR